MGIDMIRKRDGREVPFDQDKIEQAISIHCSRTGSMSETHTRQIRI